MTVYKENDTICGMLVPKGVIILEDYDAALGIMKMECYKNCESISNKVSTCNIIDFNDENEMRKTLVSGFLPTLFKQRT